MSERLGQPFSPKLLKLHKQTNLLNNFSLAQYPTNVHLCLCLCLWVVVYAIAAPSLRVGGAAMCSVDLLSCVCDLHRLLKHHLRWLLLQPSLRCGVPNCHSIIHPHSYSFHHWSSDTKPLEWEGSDWSVSSSEDHSCDQPYPDWLSSWTVKPPELA